MLQLFYNLEIAIQQSKEPAQSVDTAIKELKVRWSLDEEGSTRGVGISFEEWVLSHIDKNHIDKRVWLEVISSIYETNTKNDKRRATITRLGASLQIEPYQLYFSIGETVLFSRDGIESFKILVRLLNNTFESVLLSPAEHCVRGSQLYKWHK